MVESNLKYVQASLCTDHTACNKLIIRCNNHTPVRYVITKPSFISVAPELKKTTFQYYSIFTTTVEFDLSSKLVLKCDAQQMVF